MADLSRYLTLIPMLFALQLYLIHRQAKLAAKSNQLEQTGWITALLAILIIWGCISTWLGITGFYLSDKFLTAYPTFWLPFVPVFAVLAPLFVSVSARKAVTQLIDATPASSLIAFHILRISAIGTGIKALSGKFSHSFEIWVGIPDLLFGISAILLYFVAKRGQMTFKALLGWNLLGVLVIIPGAPIVAQTELPGFLFIAEQTPPMTTLYEFPMVLAPSLVVPLFVTVNLFVAMRLIQHLITGKHQ